MVLNKQSNLDAKLLRANNSSDTKARKKSNKPNYI